MKKRLTLSQTDKKISGVCGGIAEYLEIDSTVVRLVYIAVTVFGTAVIGGVIAYFIAAAVMPKY
ncbi:PspC domain-containing protein [Alkaliphilus serpentinus]|uniref:PspC domain-containing protein n=1 Tax=Alkaliphilus serpentinus TaxID=1482731 RepID=A0A833HRN1_9FIRM|nr:PspC domain-containing protein [Alkaliphilus serpentinus]KAB3533537.1 PspC domain-containing protein [Alkaliphilus serpentinus]